MYESSLLSWKDIFVVPILLVLLHFFLKSKQKYLSSNLRPYFLPAWYIRVFGTVLNIIQIEFYYGTGDMFTYYTCATRILNLLISNPIEGLHIIFSSPNIIATYPLLELPHQEYLASEVIFVSKIGAILGLFTFGSYSGMSILASLFCFWGCWKLYETFTQLYPLSYKLLAYAILFVPSVWFWGTTLMKDPLSLGSLGILTYYIYRTFKKKEYFIKNYILIIINSYIILNTKSYILLCFLPFIAFWNFSGINISLGELRIKKSLVLLIITPIGLAIIYFIFLFLIPLLSDRFSLNNLIDTSEYVREFIKNQTEIDDGSGYDLGEINISITGLIKLVPLGINVTLFRPYLWEIRKLINIPSAGESFITLIITLWVILKCLQKGTLWNSIRNTDVIFCLGYSLVFAFFIGISTFNFGALVRYKIPILPFYFTGLVLMYQSIYSRKKDIL